METPKSLLDHEVHVPALSSLAGSFKLTLGDQLWKYSRSTLRSHLMSNSPLDDATLAIVRY